MAETILNQESPCFRKPTSNQESPPLPRSRARRCTEAAAGHPAGTGRGGRERGQDSATALGTAALRAIKAKKLRRDADLEEAVDSNHLLALNETKWEQVSQW